MDSIPLYLQHHQAILAPISKEHPCGENLEYDPSFILLMSKIAHQNDIQYGDYIKTPDGINWKEVEEQCLSLLKKTKDIRLIIILLRARSHLSHAEGIREGLALLYFLISRYPNDLHPTLYIDGEYDPIIRSNALAALNDPDGFLHDLRQTYISKNMLLQLQLRDIERSFMVPRPPDSMPWEHIQQQLHGLYEDKSPTFFALLESLHYLESIDQVLHEQLHEDSPNLSDALRLLSRLVVKKDRNTEDNTIREDSSEESLNESASQKNTLLADKVIRNELDAISDEQHILTSEHHNRLPSQKKYVPISINNRKEAIFAIKKATLWFIENEPSSPVIILLNQAEKMIGKKFSEVFQSIPEELVYQWSKEPDENTL